MLKFIFKRILYGILTMFIVASITFFLVHIIPGNPIETIAENLPEERRNELYSQYGYDKSLFTQYIVFWKNLLVKGDLGYSAVILFVYSIMALSSFSRVYISLLFS